MQPSEEDIFFLWHIFRTPPAELWEAIGVPKVRKEEQLTCDHHSENRLRLTRRRSQWDGVTLPALV